MSNVVTWLVSEEAFSDRPGDGLVKVLNKNKNVRVIEFLYDPDERKYNPKNKKAEKDYSAFKNSIKKTQWEQQVPIVCHGPIKFNTQIRKDITNGRFLTNWKNEKLYSNVYMSRYPLEWFLNSGGVFLTLNMLRQVGLGVKERAFIRPNSPYKTFTGFSINSDNFYEELNFLRDHQQVSGEDLILVAPQKEIRGEFRVTIADRKIVGFSTYQWENILDVRRDITLECLSLAEKVANHSDDFDTVYCVDLCETENGPKIVEFTSFDSAGFYATDLEAMSESVTDFALKLHTEEFSI